MNQQVVAFARNTALVLTLIFALPITVGVVEGYNPHPWVYWALLASGLLALKLHRDLSEAKDTDTASQEDRQPDASSLPPGSSSPPVPESPRKPAASESGEAAEETTSQVEVESGPTGWLSLLANLVVIAGLLGGVIIIGTVGETTQETLSGEEKQTTNPWGWIAGIAVIFQSLLSGLTLHVLVKAASNVAGIREEVIELRQENTPS